MNSELLLLNLSDKINSKSCDKYVALSYLSICYTWKYIKTPYKNNIFKISTPHGIINLNIGIRVKILL